MKKFELPSGTWITITKATPRKEHHGDELVQAISLRMSCNPENAMTAALTSRRLNENTPRQNWPHGLLTWHPNA